MFFRNGKRSILSGDQSPNDTYSTILKNNLQQQSWSEGQLLLRCRALFCKDYWYIGYGIIIFLIIVLTSFPYISHADIATFYPSSCLGGWKNPSNATGEPDLSPKANPEDFTRSNSASTENADASIFCGGFSGEIPDGVTPKKFTLKFSLSVDDGTVIHKDENTDTVQPAVTETGESVLAPTLDEAPQAAPVDESSATSTPDSTPETPVPSTTSDTPTQSVENDTTPEPVPESNASENATTPKPAETDTPTEPAPQPAPTDTTSGPTTFAPAHRTIAFFTTLSEKIFAHAADDSAPQSAPIDSATDAPATSQEPQPATSAASTDTPADAASTSNPDSSTTETTSESSIPSSDTAISTDTTEATTQVDTSTAPAPEEITPQPNATEAAVDPIIEVRYTLDGTNWTVLDTINRQSWKNVSFQLPLTAWDDLSKLQVELHTLPTIDTAPSIYLDAMSIVVENEKTEQLPTPPTIELKDASLILSGEQDYTGDATPTFDITDPELSKFKILGLVEADQARVIEDKDNVLKTTTDVENSGAVGTIVNTIQDIFTATTHDTVSPSAPVISPQQTTTSATSPTDIPAITTTTTQSGSEQPAQPILDSPQSPPADNEPITTSGPVSFITQDIPNFLKVIHEIFSAQTVYAQTSSLPAASTIEAVVLNADGSATTIVPRIVTLVVDGVQKRQIKIDKPKQQYRPGVYKLRITFHTPTATYISEQDFTWGVLAINPDKSIYLPGNTAFLQMGVLDDDGHTVCHADLDLTITAPNGSQTHLTTTDGSIIADEQCGPDNIISVPDYYAHYTVPNQLGTYKMVLNATTYNGLKTISDSFEVQSSVPFDVTRTAPTRINPNAIYQVTMNIVPTNDWNGTITETVPAGFVISAASQGKKYDKVITLTDTELIVWKVALTKGVPMTIGYRFDAPNISPQLFLLGPLTFTQGAGTVDFQETRQWQIASDLTCNSQAGGGGLWNSTASWSCGRVPTTNDIVVITTAQAITVNVNTNAVNGITINTGATLTTDNSSRIISINNTFTNNGTFTAGNSTVKFARDVSGTAFGGSFTGTNQFNNLQFSPAISATRTYTIGVAVDIGGNFTISPTSASGSQTFIVNLSGTTNITGTLTIQPGTNTTTQLDTTSANNYALSAGTVNIDGSAGTAASLNIRNSTFTLTGTSGTILTKGTNGSFNTSGSSTTIFNGDGSPTALTNNANFTFDTLQLTPTITSNRAYTFGTGSLTTGDFTINPTATSTTKTLTVNLGGTTSVGNSNTLTITGTTTGASTLDTTSANSYALGAGFITIATAGTLIGNASTIVLSGTSGTLFTVAGTFTPGTSTVVFNPNASVTLTSNNNISFRNINLTPTLSSGAITYTFGTGTLTVDGNINVKPSASAASQSLTVNLGGDITMTGGTGKSLTIQPDTTNAPTAIVDMRPASTDYNYLGSASIDIEANGTLDASSASSSIYAATFTNNGTFTAGNSTVYENIDAGGTLYTGSFTGSNAFYNLTFNPAISVNRTYTLGAALDVTNNFSIAPTGGGSLTLNVDMSGTLTVGGTLSVQPGSGTLATLITKPSSTSYDITANLLDINSRGELDAGSSTSTITITGTNGNPFTISALGSFAQGSSTVVYTGNNPSGNTTVLTSVYNNLTVNNASETYELSGSTTIGSSATLTITDGTLDTTSSNNYTIIAGHISIANSATAALKLNASTVNITGTSGTLITLGASGTFDAGTSSINLNGNGSATVYSGTFTGSNAFYNLTSSGTGSKTTPATNFEVKGVLTVSAGFFGGSTQTLYLSGTSGTPLVVSGGQFDPPLIVEYNGNNASGNTTVEANTGNSPSYYKLYLNNASETYVLNGNTVVEASNGGGITITAGTFDTSSSGNYSLDADRFTIANDASAIFNANASAITIVGTSGTLMTRGASGSFNGGTASITLSGNGSATVNSGSFTGSNAFYNLTSSGTGTKTLGGDLEVGNVFTISAGTFSGGSSNLTLSGTTGTPFATPVGTWSAGTGTVTYSGNNGAGNTSIQDVSYYNLAINNSSETYVATGALNLNTSAGTLAINNGTLDTTASNYAINAGSIAIASASGAALTANASTITLSATSGTLFAHGTNGTFTAGTSTVIMNPNASVSITSGPFTNANSFYNLQLTPVLSGGAKTYTTGGVVTVTNNFDIKPTASTTSQSLTVNLGGNLTVLGSTGTLTIQPGTTNSPAATLDTRPATTDYNVTAITIDIEANGTLDASSSSSVITVAAFTNNGSFSAGTSTVVGSADASGIGYAGSFTGSNKFYNLEFSPSMSVSRTYTLGVAIDVGNNFNIIPTATTTGLTFTVNLSGDVNVTGTLTLQPGTTNSPAALLDLRPATTDYNLSAGKIDIEANGTLDGTSAASTITLTGTSSTLFTLNSGTFIAGSTTVVMNPNATVTLTSGTITFNNLQLTPVLSGGAKTYTFGGNTLTINGNFDIKPTASTTSQSLTVNMGANIVMVASKTLTIQPGATNAPTATLDPRPSTSDYNLTIGNLDIEANGTLDATSSSTAITLTGTGGTPFTNNGTFTVGTSTVSYTGNNASGNTTITPTTYYNLTVNNSSETFVLAGTTTVNAAATLTVTNGTLDTTASNYAISAGHISIAGVSTAILNLNASTLSLTGTTGTLITLTAGGVFTAGTSTVNLTGNGGPQVYAGTFTGTNAFYNLTSSGTGFKTTPGANNFEVKNVFTVSNGTFGGSSQTLFLSGTTGTPLVVSGGTFDPPQTVEYNGNNASGNTTISANPGNSPSYYKLVLNNASETYVLGGNITVQSSGGGSTTVTAGTLDTDAAHSYSLTTDKITIANTATAIFNANASTITLTGTAVSPLFVKNTSGVFNQGTSTVIISANVTNPITSSNAITFYNLQLSPALSGGAKTYTLGTAALTVNNNFDIKPTATATSQSLTVNMAGDITVGGTLTIQPGATNAPTATLDLRPATTNYNITAGGIDIESNATMDAGSTTSSITDSGNWTNNGTFTQGTSTVTLNGGTTATVSGTTTFYNLTITHTAAKEVDFAVSGTPIFHVTNSFTVTGHSGNLIKLYSTSAGTKWQFHPTGTATVDYADVKDGGCQAGSITITPTNSISSGNNDSCWLLASLTFSISDNSIGFGTLTTANARYATGDTNGTSTDSGAAHTLSLSTTAPGGYTLTYYGDTLKNGSNSITAAAVTDDADGTPGSSQFGASYATDGASTIATGYDHNATASLRDWKWIANTTTTVASKASSVASTENISAYYLANIASTTAAGSYSTAITYIVTGNF